MAELKTKKVRHYRVMSNLLGITRYIDSYKEAKQAQYNLNCAEKIVGALQLRCPMANIYAEYQEGPLTTVLFDGIYRDIETLYKVYLKSYVRDLNLQVEALDTTVKELNLKGVRAVEVAEALHQLERQYRLLKEALRNSLPKEEELQ